MEKKENDLINKLKQKTNGRGPEPRKTIGWYLCFYKEPVNGNIEHLQLERDMVKKAVCDLFRKKLGTDNPYEIALKAVAETMHNAIHNG